MAVNNLTKKKNNGGATYLGDYASGNFTPNYDYVSGYYKPNAGYQDPSRYGYKSSMYNIPTNAGFGIPMKDGDNAWNIGAMLGGLWGANYNQRGAAKASKEASDMLQAEYNKAMGIENPQPQQPSKADQMYDMAQKAGAIPEQQTKLQMPGSETTPKAEDLGKGLTYFDQQGNVTGPQQPDYKGTKLSYIDQKYGLTSGQPHDNPEGDKKEGTKVGEAVGGDISNIDVTKLPQGFNSDLLRANIVSKLKAAGRNEWQIAQAMQGIEPQILGKQREYNDQKFGELYQQYDALVNAGRIDDAGIVLDRMKQFSPERAETLAKKYEKVAGYQAKKDQIAENVKLLREEGFSEDDIKDFKRRALLGVTGGSTRGIGGSGTRGSKGTGGYSVLADGSVWSKQDQKDWDDLTKMAQDAEKNGKTLPAPLVRKLADLTNRRFGLNSNIPIGQNPQGSQQVPNNVDFSNVDQVESLAGRKLNKLGNNVTSDGLLNIAKELEEIGTSATSRVAEEYKQQAVRLKAEEEETKKTQYRDSYGYGPTFLGININDAIEDKTKNLYEQYKDAIG